MKEKKIRVIKAQFAGNEKCYFLFKYLLEEKTTNGLLGFQCIITNISIKRKGYITFQINI